jgi:CheY-like chemotaxis protein
MDRLPKILIAEDDHEDCVIITEIFKELGYTDTIQFVENGLELIDYLGKNRTDPSVNLIVLDLNMPLLNGTDTLRIIKNDPEHMHIPVIIFSTSVNHKEKETCLRLGAVEYITKPSSYAQYIEVCNKFYALSQRSQDC